jgi:hypothetical protein
VQHASVGRLRILMALYDSLRVLRYLRRVQKRMRQLQLRIQKVDTKPVRLRHRIWERHGRIVSPLDDSRLKTLSFAVCVLFMLAPAIAHAQGCAQCLDTTRATPPAVQAAYRHAIILMVGAASTLFIAGLVLLRRDP